MNHHFLCDFFSFLLTVIYAIYLIVFIVAGLTWRMDRDGGGRKR